MAESGNVLDFGRVIYVEPNNDINGTGKGTNFTFNPEDYSILVDLQVDVVDRYAYNGSSSNESIQYTLEWDAKGTKTSMFKGTNGMLTTRALNTSFEEVANNYNQEAIGINSIDIRYNSWNYPEITVQFTDIRGASLLSTADYTSSALVETANKSDVIDNFANSFFSTFFRFPYPRYTLIVKGFYGRPVSYSLCVNDFKTKFNSSTGNFDVTVSFIGYMYGVFTDIPMRLLLAAPYQDPYGKNYWKINKDAGKFVYDDTKTPMFTIIELEKLCNGILSRLDEVPELLQLFNEKKEIEKRKEILDTISTVYNNYVKSFKVTDDFTINDRKYIVFFSGCEGGKECPSMGKNNHIAKQVTGSDGVERTVYYITQPSGVVGTSSMGAVMTSYTEVPCPDCNGLGIIPYGVDKSIEMGGDSGLRVQLWKKVEEYNSMVSVENNIPMLDKIDNEENAKNPMFGYITYSGVTVNDVDKYIMTAIEDALKPDSPNMRKLDEADKDYMGAFLRDGGLAKANSVENSKFVAVSILRVSEFESTLKGLTTKIEEDIKNINERLKEKQNEVVNNLLGFNLTLKNVIDMCLAHLATFMFCMYNCMDLIKGQNGGQGRLFSDAGNLSVTETDILSKVDPGQTASGIPAQVYLPPFFAFKKKDPQTDVYEDEWIGNDARFSNRNIFEEIKLIDGFINGTLEADKEASASTANYLAQKSEEVIPPILGKDYEPTFVSDYFNKRNPYANGYDGNVEDFLSIFAFRCMLAAIYSRDYPNVGNRFDNGDKYKTEYFEHLGGTDAKNFSSTTVFDTFRKGEKGMKDVFTGITWDDFESYITGKGGNIKKKNEEIYRVGNMDSPIFTKDGNNFIISYGNTKNGKYFVPLNFDDAKSAVDICNDIYNQSTTTGSVTTQREGFGVSRKYAMPVITITKGGISSEVKEHIESGYGDDLKKGNISQIGWYFRNEENWKKYFSGAAKGIGNGEFWFPTLFSTDNVTLFSSASDNIDDKKDINGILYNGQAGVDGIDTFYAKAPYEKPFADARSFYVNENAGILNKVIRYIKSWWTGESTNNTGVASDTATDEYVEKNLIGGLIDTPESVTLIGLLCGDESLFESEFYAVQSSDWGKAYLFLHSLPTSEYGCLGHAVSTIIMKTYTPSITDIPYATALFMGALYLREKNSNDFLVVPSGFKKPGKKQLVTYDGGTKSNGNIIRRPLHPIPNTGNGSNYTYLNIVSDSVDAEINKLEKDGFTNGKDARLRKYLEGKDDSALFHGFWDVHDDIKNTFINLFIEWVNSDFQEIKDGLELRKPDGTRFTAQNIVDTYKEIAAFKGKERKTRGGETYNDFVTRTFYKTLFDNHTSLGLSSTGKGFYTMLRPSSDVVKKVTALMTNGCAVIVSFPRTLVTRDMFLENERESLKVSKGVLQAAWNKFKSGIMESITAKETADEQNKGVLESNTPSSVPDGVKLSLYESLKNIHDKWLISTKIDKYIYDKERSGYAMWRSFHYINSFHENVGDTITLNIEELPKQIETAKFASNENACSLYSFMYDVANQARVQLLALPIFNDMADKQYVRDMFTPMPYDEINVNEIYTETEFVFMYPEEASKQVTLPNDYGSENDQYKFIDDSFMLVTESGLENKDAERTPATFWNTRESNVPVIGVTFAKQNQSFFKNINVSMDNPRTTEVAINNTFLIANKFSGENAQVTALGQDLFSIYSNYSYECGVEMMGCACIMPLMYFQLNNIPMFKGTYIIYNVSHSITPGNMTTTFTGQRLSRYRKKRNDNAFAIVPNDNALLGNQGGYTTSSGNNPPYCYDCMGKRLDNEETYTTMTSISGVNDKAALRAVEYAETHYTGGFFNDGKLKVYYDPWMARREAGILRSDISVGSQTATSYVIPDSFQGNITNINAATSIVGGDKISPKDATFVSSKVAECCTYGAFGIPGKWYSQCGVSSVKDLWDGCASGFGAQGTYFATLLKNNPDMKNALQNKDWKKFADLYKADVYMPGDEGKAKYIKDLETGYYMADTASPDNVDKYVNSPGQDFEVPNKGGKELDVRAAINALNKATIVVHNSGQSGYKQINTTEKNSRGELYKCKGKTLNEYGCTPGAKPDFFPLGLCATYVKGALEAGGVGYYPSCNGGACRERLLDNGWTEIYVSKPGDDWLNNSKWQPGDVMTIDGFTLSGVGHIAMWNGTNWVSDFKQKNCICYTGNESVSKQHWNSGGYHFFRYGNRINM